MPSFLTLFEGPSPLKAKPFLATQDQNFHGSNSTPLFNQFTDPKIIAAVRRLLEVRKLESEKVRK